jgi:hypothetical protein
MAGVVAAAGPLLKFQRATSPVAERTGPTAEPSQKLKLHPAQMKIVQVIQE